MTSVSAEGGAASAVMFEFDAPYEVARWRPLVHWIMVIPHFIVLYVLSLVASVLVFLSWWAILFTGHMPRGFFDFLAMTQRYQTRAATFMLFMRESYPDFEFASKSDDPGGDPVRYSIRYSERLSRGLIFVKWLLVIPHVIALAVLGLVAYVSLIGAFFAVLFTGRYPAGIRNLLVGLMRWQLRFIAYAYLMTDDYPPFSLH